MSNNMLNTGVSLYPPESFVLGKDSIGAGFMTM